MIYSVKLSARLAGHIAFNNLRGNKKFPFVLMLEPLFKCNLSCSGCGRIIEYRDMLEKFLSPEECLDAAKQSGAQIISITGGEPLVHPKIKEIINLLIKHKYFVYLCTNGLLLSDFLDDISPSPNLSFVVHLDGLADIHNAITGNKKTFDKAVEGIEKALKKKFIVRTNTTIYRDTDIEKTLELFKMLGKIGTHGIMVSPAYSYEDVKKNMFLTKKEINSIFMKIYDSLNGTKIYNTPIYWEFLAGKRNLDCTPWANPTFNPAGWKSPCYLITDTHFKTYKELIEKTQWQKYGKGNDLRCENCMIHSGFEASAIKSIRNISDFYKILKWSFTGKKV